MPLALRPEWRLATLTGYTVCVKNGAFFVYLTKSYLSFWPQSTRLRGAFCTLFAGRYHTAA